MEQVIELTAGNELAVIKPSISHAKERSSSKPFIEANTTESSLEEIKQQHIIPVWLKDNEPLQKRW